MEFLVCYLTLTHANFCTVWAVHVTKWTGMISFWDISTRKKQTVMMILTSVAILARLTVAGKTMKMMSWRIRQEQNTIITLCRTTYFTKTRIFKISTNSMIKTAPNLAIKLKAVFPRALLLSLFLNSTTSPVGITETFHPDISHPNISITKVSESKSKRETFNFSGLVLVSLLVPHVQCSQ